MSVGVKSDPIEYRYTYPWLFRVMADCGVRWLQLGTFFELYDLPDAFFVGLREQAAQYGVAIRSVFTSHRELGGFFRDEPGWVETARSNYERLIDVAAVVGAESAGTNPGSVPRDRTELKPAGVRTYLNHMKELMAYAKARGVGRLTLEPMSCLAEPPCTPDEVQEMMEELRAHHLANPDTISDVGVCADVSHGYVNEAGRTVYDHMALLEAEAPYITEVHLKNTDGHYASTFGFSEAERARGVVDLSAVSDLLRRNAERLPVKDLVGYLEIGGPKTGRDYSDHLLEGMLRSSLRHCREAFAGDRQADGGLEAETVEGLGTVRIAPSLMCADALHLEDAIRDLEAIGADLLHLDIMDARFTPNMPVGLGMVEAVASASTTPMDAHLMVMDNDLFVERLARLGVRWVSVHVESARHLDRTLARIRDLGMKAGAALNPATPLNAIRHVLDRLDFVVIMTVNPGFAGQSLVPGALRKIADCRRMLDESRRSILIQVDGNVSFANVPTMVANGADILVCGSSSLFASGSLRENAARLRNAVAEGLRARGEG
jgi:ribulose-phosphate 3-epimerase